MQSPLKKWLDYVFHGRNKLNTKYKLGSTIPPQGGIFLFAKVPFAPTSKMREAEFLKTENRENRIAFRYRKKADRIPKNPIFF